jgi:triphosphoribosyl-dephospho-CoA synthase
MTAAQFMTSARVSSGPISDPRLPLGKRILEAVRATREAVATNTNLGILLLAGPLARAAEISRGGLRDNLQAVLEGIDPADTAAVFEAIALAAPGGLGAAENDVREAPRVTLIEAMKEAAGRDRIARQYVTGFDDVFGLGVGAIEAALARGEDGIWPAVFAHMAFFSGFPDSHVMRKHGADTAGRVRDEAVAVNAALHAAAGEEERLRLLLAFDRRLKAARINPGTSADLTVASLFVHGLAATLHNGGDGD